MSRMRDSYGVGASGVRENFSIVAEMGLMGDGGLFGRPVDEPKGLKYT